MHSLDVAAIHPMGILAIIIGPNQGRMRRNDGAAFFHCRRRTRSRGDRSHRPLYCDPPQPAPQKSRSGYPDRDFWILGDVHKKTPLYVDRAGPWTRIQCLKSRWGVATLPILSHLSTSFSPGRSAKSIVCPATFGRSKRSSRLEGVVLSCHLTALCFFLTRNPYGRQKTPCRMT